MPCARNLAGIAIAALLALAGGAAGAAGASTATPGTATATGYAALLPAGTQGAVTATSTGAKERSASAGGLRPAGGGTVGGVDVHVGAAPDGAEGVAEGTIDISGVTLLDGRVSISEIRMSARATASPSGAEAGLTEASVSGVTVDGRAQSAGPGSRVDVPGIGTLVLLESASDGAGGLRANALRVEVTDPQAAGVIGQPFVIGHLDLSAIAGQEAPPPPATAPRRPPRRPRPRRRTSRRRRRRGPARRPPRRSRPRRWPRRRSWGCHVARSPRSRCPTTRATSSRCSAT